MKNRAFTLIELLVVVLIIGILAAIAVPKYQEAVDRSQLSEAILMARNIKNQQELFYLQNGRYAQDCVELNADFPAGIEKKGNNFYLNKGSYYVFYHCNNGNVDVSISLRDNPSSSKASFLAGINIYFDQGLSKSNQKYKGKMYCFSNFNDKWVQICKDLGKEKRSDKSYWL